MFGKVLHQPNLWHLNRRSVSRAFFLGMFWAFIPLPSQMIVAVACAIPLRANLAIAATLVWITNPFTMAPIYYALYRFGRWLLGQPAPPDMTFSVEWLMANLRDVWAPLYFGSFVFSTLIGLASYLLMNAWWRWYHIWKWRRRGHRAKPQGTAARA